MIRDLLPDTGPGAHVGVLLLLAIACVVAGTSLVLLARRSRTGTRRPFSPSSTSTSSSSAVGRLTVTQTSTMAGLAPGVAPAPITGRLVNHSAESTHITAVDVEIASITPRPNSSAGACWASDYELIAARMPVGRTLGPGGSTGFAGASIGFNKKTNQAACKGATIHLLYTATRAELSCTMTRRRPE